MNLNTLKVLTQALERGYVSREDLMQMSEYYPWLYLELRTHYGVTTTKLKDSIINLRLLPFDITFKILVAGITKYGDN